jgi:ABC-2 type transport system ATP-binding protein
MAAIEISGLVKRYGPRTALAGVDLVVAEGAVHGFLGPNGAGKTTTMRVLLGLLHADAGTVRVLGADPWRDGRQTRARIGYLPGGAGLYGRMRGRQLLDYFTALDGIPPVIRARACEALRLSADELDRPVRTYSRGMRQKLAIVQSLQHDPTLAVLDEPTEGLDPLVQEGFFDLLRERRAAGRTIFFSSHVLSEVEQLCERVAIIRDGRIVAEGTVAELRERRPRRVTPVLADPAAAVAIPGAEVVARRDETVVLAYRGEAAPLLRALAALDLRDARIEEPGLDEVFRGYYEADGR